MTQTGRSTLILGTAGHIDHGKTALVRALTGVDTDRLPQEKQRGITIDIGFAKLELPPFAFGVVDVPGHERFIKNMLAGATGIDLVLLVVAADDSIMPQTREHLTLCQLLGIPQGVVAITKADLADADQIEKVRADIAGLTRGTFLDGAPVIETSVMPNRGIDQLRLALVDAAGQVARPTLRDVFRMAIDRSFHQAGHGTVVTGTVAAGRVHVEDQVQCMPGGKLLRVRNLHCHGQRVTAAGYGQRTAINLAAIDHEDIGRGNELATPGYLRPCRYLIARVQLLESSPFPLKNRGTVRLHLGTQSLGARAEFFDRTLLEPKQTAWVQLVSSQPAVGEVNQPIVLRSESPVHTIGGGHLWWLPDDRITKQQWHDLEPTLVQLQSDDPKTRLCAAIELYGHTRRSHLDLCRDAQLTRTQVRELTRQALAEQTIMSLSSTADDRRLMHRRRWDAITKQAIKRIEALHKQAPDKAALDRSMVIATLADELDADLAELLLEQLIQDGQLTAGDQGVALKSFAATLTAAQTSLHEQVLAMAKQAGLTFLDEAKMLEQLNAARKDLKAVLSFARQQGQLVHLGQGRYIDRMTLDEAAGRLRSVITQQDGMTMAQIRDLWDTTRRYALPICEYMDAKGLTQRDGNLRRWVGPGDAPSRDATHTKHTNNQTQRPA